MFGEWMSRNARHAHQNIVLSFLRKFGELTACFTKLDIRLLRDHNGDTLDAAPTLISGNYLAGLGYLLNHGAPNIGCSLETAYYIEWPHESLRVLKCFTEALGGIDNLTALVKGLLKLVPKHMKVIEQLHVPCMLAYRIYKGLLRLPSGSPGRDYHTRREKNTILGQQAYRFYSTLSGPLAEIVEKYPSHLKSEAVDADISALFELFIAGLKIEPSPAASVIAEHAHLHPSIPEERLANVIAYDWKLRLLTKLLVCGQMQLRVLGVAQMCKDFLNVWNDNRSDDRYQPVLAYFGDFIKNNKLVNYLVGIGSHSELIAECGNIIGFLAATKNYGKAETDVIWKTVATSEDPRLVDAILIMLKNLPLGLLGEGQWLYFCKKCLSLTPAAYTREMRSFLTQTFQELMTNAQKTAQLIDAQPYELCVRILQDTSALQDASGALKGLQEFASNSLRELGQHGPESPTRFRIYAALAQDIAERSPSSCGSMCALTQFLSCNMPNDLHQIALSHDLTRLVVEHLEFANNSASFSLPGLSDRSPVNTSRRDLIHWIATHEPKSLADEVGQRLWIALVGRGAPSVADRGVGWTILNATAAKTYAKGPYVTTCFKDYLPALDPLCYQPGTLEFAQKALSVWLANAEGDLLDKGDTPGFDALEQLWTMVLTAPPRTIEVAAVNLLVEVFTSSDCVRKMPKPRAHEAHLTLVNRCLQQLSNTAAKLRALASAEGDAEPMDLSEPALDIGTEELCFTRSLLILREFLRSYQAKPYWSGKKRPAIIGKTDLAGETLEMQFQVIDRQKHASIEKMDIGSNNTIADLIAILARGVGFNNLKLYHWGTEISAEKTGPGTLIKDARTTEGLLLVVKQEDDISGTSPPLSISVRLEDAIMDHFDELYDYLGMEERLAKEIYQFLVKFPAHPKLLAVMDDDARPWIDVFPSSLPFKCLYAVYALRQHISSASTENQPLITRSLGLVVSALVNPQVLDSCKAEALSDNLAHSLVECLCQLLQKQVPNEAADQNLTTALLKCLLQLLEKARLNITESAPQMISSTLEAILEASLHSKSFWTAFASSASTLNKMRLLLLEHPNIDVRRQVQKLLTKKCLYVPSGAMVTVREIAETFWAMIRQLVEDACTRPCYCDQIFGLAQSIFKGLAETNDARLDIDGCFLQWGRLLIRHDSTESIGGAGSVDARAQGLASLLHLCTQWYTANEHALPPNGFAVHLLNKHLFPPLSQDGSDTVPPEPKVILNGTTRYAISSVIYSLTRDDQHSYHRTMKALRGITPYHGNGSSIGDMSYHYDRSKHIRSDAGYVGLKNLSNTCYLNSLMTQLFMNPVFRDFMLNVGVDDDDDSRQLLVETRKLFGFMQNSYRRFVDPWSFASHIRTYDDAHIDVNIQMDVDEFYNLLFDRWEGQMQPPPMQRKFRSIYGGQLVQQIKSKECPHISERLEPFSAIQCDIKGKSSLQESLQAYVDGEVMEGDNKYKCSTCDKHVDAVKRACLKDIPDNIIFHLKRFDFNLRTMMRSKINDRFEFPQSIDMRPYTVEHLMEPAEPLPSDQFELVGILVHTGTAESGHYYSYIRERPSASGYASWFEFNDDTVSHFDPANIESHCFGGAGEPNNAGHTFEKSWSAYMLFYQRSSVVQAQRQEFITKQSLKAPKMGMPVALSNFITMENEVLLRKYCLHDENHADFVLQMAKNARRFAPDKHCSDSHEEEDLVVETLVSHLDQVVSRANDLPNLKAYFSTIGSLLKSCSQCSQMYLEWLTNHIDAFRALLLRNPEPDVREDTRILTIAALKELKDSDPEFITQATVAMDSIDDEDDESIFCQLIGALQQVHEAIHVAVRGWPEYFGLLHGVALLGPLESAALIDASFLLRALEILTYDRALPPHPQYSRILGIAEKRPASRPLAYDSIIALVKVLLQRCDRYAAAISESEIRTSLISDKDALVPLSEPEFTLVVQHWTRGTVNVLIDKLIGYNQNAVSTRGIIEWMVEGFDETHPSIYHAIRNGVRRITSQNATMCVGAALVYCEKSVSVDFVTQLYKLMGETTKLQVDIEGREHIRFFTQGAQIISGHKLIDDELQFQMTVDDASTWLPTLLNSYDEQTRVGAEEYVDNYIQLPYEDLDDHGPHRHKKARYHTALRQLGFECLIQLNKEYIKRHTEVVKAHVEPILKVIEDTKCLFDDNSDEELDQKFFEHVDRKLLYFPI